MRTREEPLAPMTQLKQLLTSVLLIAFGAALYSTGLWFAKYPAAKYFVMNLALWFAGAALVGAGIASLFRRTGWGAIIGFGLQVLAVFALGFKS